MDEMGGGVLECEKRDGDCCWRVWGLCWESRGSEDCSEFSSMSLWVWGKFSDGGWVWTDAYLRGSRRA